MTTDTYYNDRYEKIDVANWDSVRQEITKKTQDQIVAGIAVGAAISVAIAGIAIGHPILTIPSLLVTAFTLTLAARSRREAFQLIEAHSATREANSFRSNVRSAPAP